MVVAFNCGVLLYPSTIMAPGSSPRRHDAQRRSVWAILDATGADSTLSRTRTRGSGSDARSFARTRFQQLKVESTRSFSTDGGIQASLFCRENEMFCCLIPFPVFNYGLEFLSLLYYPSERRFKTVHNVKQTWRHIYLNPLGSPYMEGRPSEAPTLTVPYSLPWYCPPE